MWLLKLSQMKVNASTFVTASTKYSPLGNPNAYHFHMTAVQC